MVEFWTSSLALHGEAPGWLWSIPVHSTVVSPSTSTQTAPLRTPARAGTFLVIVGLRRDTALRKGREHISVVPSPTLQELFILMQGLALNLNIFR